MEVLVEFQNKFRINELKIYETEYWIWSLRPHQATIGAGILSLKRECRTFSELKPEEFVDLNKIIKVIEPTIKNLFEYDAINYLMLMMFDNHVHYHILPRYQKAKLVIGQEWKDENWPVIPPLLGEPLIESELKKITSLIKDNIK